MKITSLILASFLVIISILFSYSQKLKLEKEIIVGVIRAVIQLTAVGYILNIIFGLENPLFTTILLLVMLYNAAYNASKRGKNIKGIILTSFISIGVGAFITLAVLVAAGAIKYTPYEIIPVSGMIISNAMTAIALCYRNISSDFKNKYMEVETKLSLGADVLPSSIEIIRESIRVGMQPTVDSMKTLGIVSLPGMMTGLILAGTPPLEAIKYQIMVTFMLLSCTSIASFLACYMSYSKFFNDRKQLIRQ
jgi:putative ABC transport system permease protein